ncbi:uncharacterized protein (DUF952 family) [Rhizobium sp. SG_E_25_P2]|uniref:DUF952 domain-containing protein n=1 Tax=Rhizobium sp. SG_E_25_P2 TaxID=2879942 RepID=UPI0024751AFF|nr:DUF952 domain-containing protein [Rhizobium sp. SG_E_25_P2]MDH6265661.1 uncharacterized protein (DUF952 family) [Rhizobium sp. SG_E_25_P2]
MTELIYKIVPAETWRQAESAGVFAGAGIDLADGFIHLSTAQQTRRTAELYFTGQTGLALVAIDTEALGPALRYEASRDGALFPHLYGPLPLSAVRATYALTLDAEGQFIFPEDMP